MTRPFPDESLSAFLDDELEPADREQVEQHLAASEADRLLVADLQRLRGDVASLPPARVSDDFTDRVLAAALAEAERTGMAIGALPTSIRLSRILPAGLPPRCFPEPASPAFSLPTRTRSN
jgi:anti-sigma factor RsiW